MVVDGSIRASADHPVSRPWNELAGSVRPPDRSDRSAYTGLTAGGRLSGNRRARRQPAGDHPPPRIGLGCVGAPTARKERGPGVRLQGIVFDDQSLDDLQRPWVALLEDG